MSEISTWYDMALHAIAAESHFDLYSNDLVKALTLGNNRLPPTEQNKESYLRLTPQQATAYTSRYAIAAHLPNDTSGFSGTLIRDTQTGRYILSFRSTEYKDETRGGD